MKLKTASVTAGILSLLALSLPGKAQTQQTIPEAVSFSGGLITASIPDLHQTLDAVQVFIDQVLPKEMQIPLKGTIGGMIGDPELKGIPEGKGSAVFWNGLQWFAVLECTEQMGNTLIGMVSLAQLQGSYEGNFLVISKEPESIEIGKTEGQNIIDALLQKDTAGLTVHLQASELVETFRPQINMLMRMMPGMMAQGAPPEQAGSMQSMAKIFEGEVRVLASMTSQLDSMEISIVPSKEAIEISYLFTVTEKTDLHSLVTAPDSIEPDPKITAEYLPPGFLEIEMFVGNPDALVTFLKAESEKLIKEMSLPTEGVEKWMGMMEMWPHFFSGSMAQVGNIGVENGFSAAYLVAVQDEARLLEFFQTLPEQMGSFMELYRDMGMPMEMEVLMNTRSYNSHPVHRYNFRYDLENMDPKAAAELKRMNMANMDSEFSIVDHRCVWSMGDLPLNSLMDAQESGLPLSIPLTAKTQFGNGGFAYYDFNMASYFELIGQMMPMEQAQELFTSLTEGLKESPPLTGAAFQQENRVLWQQKVPVEFVREMTKLISTGIEQPIPAQEMEIAE